MSLGPRATVRIVPLRPEDSEAVQQAASLLVEGFRENSPEAWPDAGAALEEVEKSFGPERLSLVALGAGSVLGWIGGIRQYRGHVWELHPIVVRSDRWGQGIGRALVGELEARVRDLGAETLWLGTDDEIHQTTLSSVDLYPDPLAHAARLRNLRGHPYEFYQRLGFVIVGVLPDANGFGKPDIFMAKRVR